MAIPNQEIYMKKAEEVLKAAGVAAEIVNSVKIDYLGCVHSVKIGTDAHIETAKKFLNTSEQTGYVPLFIMNDSYGEFMDVLVDNHKGFQNCISLASKVIEDSEFLNMEEWLARKNRYKIGSFNKHPRASSEIPTSETLVLVPVKHSWQIPAVFRFGGWHSCPPPSVQVALHKRWNEKFGSEIIWIARDALTCLVNNPVDSQDQALCLAREQAAYCPDNILQGHGDGTISGLAIDLLNAKAWDFWWD